MYNSIDIQTQKMHYYQYQCGVFDDNKFQSTSDLPSTLNFDKKITKIGLIIKLLLCLSLFIITIIVEQSWWHSHDDIKHLTALLSKKKFMKILLIMMTKFIKAINVFTLVAFISFDKAFTLNNGLAKTPPMGWLSWERFICNIDCKDYPNECINQQLYMSMIDRLATDGFKQVGYQYVNIDDCWSELKRDPQTNRLVPDRKRFPNGIKHIANYAHSKGIKLGIYGDVGTNTCGGYPGSLMKNGSDYFQIDADTFAEWQVDSLKLDGCYANTSDYSKLYPKMEQALNSTNRDILYSCSWPAYLIGQNPDYDKISKYCNLWRNFDDIVDSWTSVTSIIDFYAANQNTFAKYNGPGQWNDPDMLIIGNFGLSLEQSKAQMALWAIFSAPLYMSNDLRQLRPEFKAILQNKHVIHVNQDELGIFGKKVFNDSSKSIEIWVKPITPIVKKLSDPFPSVVDQSYSYAIVYFNRKTLGGPQIVSKELVSIIPQISTSFKYYVYDLFDNGKLIGKLSTNDSLVLKVNGSGGVRMVKIIPVLS